MQTTVNTTSCLCTDLNAKFLEDCEMYSEPSSEVSDHELYGQLSSEKYHEILRHQIR